eukprot:jgi/Mesen1/2019/ME000148S01121
MAAAAFKEDGASAVQTASKQQLKNSTLLVFVLAGVSNMCAAAITNPVNVVKVRMQLDGALSSAKVQQYHGLGRGMWKVWAEEGVRGLWRGTTAALLREASYSSIRMGAYEPFKQALGARDAAHTPLWVKVGAAAASGTLGSALANPTDVVMIRMQAPLLAPHPHLAGGAAAARAYTGAFHAFATIARHEGLGGLYRGVVPSMQRAALLTAAQIPSYDQTKHLLLNSGVFAEGIPCHVASSMTAGLVTAVVIAPVDLVKTRIMQQQVGVDGKGLLYSSAIDCFRKSLQAEGFAGMYKGFIPVWMRIGPHTNITFFIYEQLRSMMGIRPL